MGSNCRKVVGFLQFFLISIFLCFSPLFCDAADTITRGRGLRDDTNETLISLNESYELGFFSPINSSSRYVGIWYHKIKEHSVIWVANRDRPLRNRDGVLMIGDDGNLVVLDGNNVSVWTSNITANALDPRNLTLHNNGELVLSSGEDSSKVHWSSFEHPTDTFLPNMVVRVNREMGEKRMFMSWKSETDPAVGNYCLGVDPRGAVQIIIWNGNDRLWRSGHWDNQIFSGIPTMRSTPLYGFKITPGNNVSVTFDALNDSDKLKFQIKWDGKEAQQRLNEETLKWETIRLLPSNDCDFYNFCGDFGLCSETSRPKCSCPQGFIPKNKARWDKGSWSDGCQRKTPLLEQRMNSNSNGTIEDGEQDGFVDVLFVKLPDFITGIFVVESCRDVCSNRSSCVAYSDAPGIGCATWDAPLKDIQKFDGAGNTLHLRLAHSDLISVDSESKLSTGVIILICLGGAAAIAILAFLLWKFGGKMKGSPDASSSQPQNKTELSMFDLSKSKELSAELSGPYELGIEGEQLSGPDLPMFSFNCIAVATDNFSEENKLGQGGFGPVYKGKLPCGQEIAVKRLSVRSGQGLEEFKNEIILIGKLQHRNLVRLLGYCIQGEDKMLLYEYMPNKSLDWFLFDPNKKALLDWKKRLSIMEGVARGLLYLHRDSRLLIIHRDLKASNILLDEDMNPKISDFGMARIFGGNQNEATNTIRVVGTYGYMAPEYAMEGLFSVKSDVYSFGVLLLELICGRRNTSFRSTEYLTLISYAWKLWNEGRAIELLDPSISDSSPENEVLKCIHVAMLCVQDSPAYRPTLQSLVLMLESESTSLPQPRQPTYTSTRASIDTDLFTEGHDIVSSNDVTVTMLDGR
ncbi:G-type lectin S-receptor-like serine/threonine-protein kinase B120 isoform X1 [Benincasa hispida]|uniref:G-type lectin S-receptor-like serine/threonine-protein kinase B120 isoform X1 n=1 Tax=Benincasa hispida TaxID=102211 RepID=UPI001902ADA6|nr:G-type lectin S-receptor-like serine/threonine-protein kinase B120 isoform X1 [Benincasa hispida]